MDGSKPGVHNELLKPFAGREKSVKVATITKDEDSTMDRYGKVQGVATVRLEEGLLIISAKRLLCPRQRFRNFPGSTAGSIIGPVVMPSLERLWELTWQQKQAVYGAKIFLQGGKLGEDQEELECNKFTSERKPDSKEPVFYHSCPETLYDDMLRAYAIKVVIDLTPGEGMLAQAAYKRSVPYVGLVFNAAHRDHLQAHLDQCLVGSLLDNDSDTYSPKLHTTLLGAVSEEDKKQLQVWRGGRGGRGVRRGRPTSGTKIWPRPRKKAKKAEHEAPQEEADEEEQDEEDLDDCSGDDNEK